MWRPIDTAPRDGKPLVVGYWHKGKWVYRLAREFGLGHERLWYTCPGELRIHPTHYAPDALPPPPGPRSD